MKHGSLLTSAGRFNEATIYCVAPPPNRSPMCVKEGRSDYFS
jgi:hypothetical protein